MLAGPLDLAVDPVPGNARFIAHDRAARTGETVEESGFAHVGAADDGQNRPGRSVYRCLAPDGRRRLLRGQRAGELGLNATHRPLTLTNRLHRTFTDFTKPSGCAGFGGRLRSRSPLDLGARVLAAGGGRRPPGRFRP